MKRVLIKNLDGSVQVMQLVSNVDGTYPSPDAEIRKWAPRKQKEVHSWREIEPEHLPSDRSFRDAWCDVAPDPTVDIDMAKARNIHRDRLRALRAPKLAALDIEMSRAFNDLARQEEIEARRQALRDVTRYPSIEIAKTMDELIAAIPPELK